MARFTLCSLLFLILLSSIEPARLCSEEIFPPFYAIDYKKEGEYYTKKITLRPFLSYYKSISYAQKDEIDMARGDQLYFEKLQLFWPLVFYKKRGKNENLQIWPFYFMSKRDAGKGFDFDWTFLPFLFYGSDPVEGKYFSFIPFGGTLKGKIGKEKILHILFPLYYRAESKGQVNTHYFWPFINVTKGSKQKGFRFWPFGGSLDIYRDKEKKVISEKRRFFLWPFFIWNKRLLETRSPASSFVSFPFYAKYDSSSLKRKAILWPIYQKTEYPKEKNIEYEFLKPLFKWGKGPNYSQFNAFPLFSKKRKNGEKSFHFLWPIFSGKKYEDENVMNKSFNIMPFFSSHSYHKLKDKKKRKRVKIWPLMEYKSSLENIKNLSIPSLFWFKDGKDGGFKNNIGKFLRLYHTRWEKGKRYKHTSLFGLIRSEKDAHSREFSFFPLFIDYKREKKKKRIRFLWGLYEYNNGYKGRRYKFLWIPFGKQKEIIKLNKDKIKE